MVLLVLVVLVVVVVVVVAVMVMVVVEVAGALLWGGQGAEIHQRCEVLCRSRVQVDERVRRFDY